MEPRRGMLIADVELGGRRLRAGTFVWLHDEGAASEREIEHDNRRYQLSAAMLVELPVETVPLERLADPCLFRPAAAFATIHVERERYRILRCCEHGAYFLADVRGGIADYELIICVGELADDNYDELWRRYHRVPGDLLRYRGLTR